MIDLSNIIYSASIGINLVAAGFNILGIRRSIKQSKNTLAEYEKAEKEYQEQTQITIQMRMLRDNLMTVCEKCKALIKLKR